MRAVSTLTALLAIGTALGSAAPSAAAVGFGRITNSTQIGQPLNFAAAIRLEPDELLPRECVSAEVQSGDNRLQPQQVRVTLEGGADGVDRSVRVTTNTLIDEPVVTVSVTLGCGAKVTRRFVAFIDPPPTNAAETAPVGTLQPQRLDSQVAPIVAIVQGDESAARAASRASRNGAPRARPRRVAPGAAADSSGASAEPTALRAARAKRTSPSPRQPMTARAAPTGSRLQVETSTPVVARSVPAASAPSAAPLPVAAAAEPASAPMPAPVAGLAAEERQRIQSLEEGVAKLRSDAQATQVSVTALQARLKAAESERYANPLVYALAALSALLAFAVAGLWWRRSRAEPASQWWAGPAPAPTVSNLPLVAAAVEPVVSAPQPLGAPHTAVDAFAVSTMVDEDAPPTRAPPDPVLSVPIAFAPSALPDEPARELSVEELIDLEQQAEFFIVLGQDEAAIELLMSHVRNDGGISPLPYLKLLEIYRRRGEADAYQRIRDRFNRRFNSYAPDWESDLQQGRSLVEYPDTILRLQQLWASPARVMETLDASLFRRNKTDDTFDLPAYRELLFLYSISRDLTEHASLPPGSAVDLLLPLDDAGEEPISRLIATTQPGQSQHGDLLTMPLDLDVSFGPDATQEIETTPAALRRLGSFTKAGDSNFIDFDLSELAAPTRSGG